MENFLVKNKKVLRGKRTSGEGFFQNVLYLFPKVFTNEQNYLEIQIGTILENNLFKINLLLNYNYFYQYFLHYLILSLVIEE